MDAFLIVTALCMAASFAVCGIPFGLIISQQMSGVDVRKTGSGNIGMTNVARSVGAGAAALTFALDVGKGLVSMLVSRWLIGLVVPEGFALETSQPAFAALTLVYLCCVLGHVYSPYLGFHGGKGISVGLGASLGLHWMLGTLALAAFIVLVVPTRRVSVGSIAAAIAMPILSIFPLHFTPWTTVPMFVVSALVIWAHRSNIVKLMHGEEQSFSVKGHGRAKQVPPTKRRGDES